MLQYIVLPHGWAIIPAAQFTAYILLYEQVRSYQLGSYMCASRVPVVRIIRTERLDPATNCHIWCCGRVGATEPHAVDVDKVGLLVSLLLILDRCLFLLVLLRSSASAEALRVPISCISYQRIIPAHGIFGPKRNFPFERAPETW